ncbi:hypothetical protein [uncultured Jatrophihabitans sp.]|uniref:hypothetical protein n=1 Tax=uncultured Jatrophihabitans sp. TaxID=1610747 RepID=UPI0035C98FAC
MLTVAAFLLLGLFVVVACETTRGRFIRLLAEQDLQPAHARRPNLLPDVPSANTRAKERSA